MSYFRVKEYMVLDAAFPNSSVRELPGKILSPFSLRHRDIKKFLEVIQLDSAFIKQPHSANHLSLPTQLKSVGQQILSTHIVQSA